MSSIDPNTTILLIDNDDRDRTYYANQLKLSSPEAIILEAKDGQAGLELCKAQKVDCIVTDFTLPDMSSFELLSDVNPAEGVSAMAMIILARYAIPALADLARRKRDSGLPNEAVDFRRGPDQRDPECHCQRKVS